MFRGPADVKLQPTNPLDKPVLDLGTFQHLLAAAYILQEQKDRLLVKEAKPDFPGTVSGHAGVALEILRAGGLKRERPTAEQVIPPVSHVFRRAASNSHYRIVRQRIAQRNGLFWSAATVAAMAAVFALLLVTSIGRLAPLPAGLALPSEEVQQPIPFHRARRAGTPPARSSPYTKTVVKEPYITDKPEPNEPAGAAAEPLEELATPVSAPKTVPNPSRVYSAYESEADVVAQNTVVRYGTRPAPDHPHAQKP